MYTFLPRDVRIYCQNTEALVNGQLLKLNETTANFTSAKLQTGETPHAHRSTTCVSI